MKKNMFKGLCTAAVCVALSAFAATKAQAASINPAEKSVNASTFQDSTMRKGNSKMRSGKTGGNNSGSNNGTMGGSTNGSNNSGTMGGSNGTSNGKMGNMKGKSSGGYKNKGMGKSKMDTTTTR